LGDFLGTIGDTEEPSRYAGSVGGAAGEPGFPAIETKEESVAKLEGIGWWSSPRDKLETVLVDESGVDGIKILAMLRMREIANHFGSVVGCGLLAKALSMNVREHEIEKDSIGEELFGALSGSVDEYMSIGRERWREREVEKERRREASRRRRESKS